MSNSRGAGGGYCVSTRSKLADDTSKLTRTQFDALAKNGAASADPH